MMQFIVLGQVPGTHFQLTFIWFQLAVALAIASLVSYAYYIFAVRTRKRFIIQAENFTLQHLDQA